MQIKLISNHVRNECLSNGIKSWIFSSTSIYNSRYRKIILNGMFKEIYTIYAILIYKACKVFIIKKIICQTVQLFISTSLQQLFLIGSKKFWLHVHVCASYFTLNTISKKNMFFHSFSDYCKHEQKWVTTSPFFARFVKYLVNENMNTWKSQ